MVYEQFLDHICRLLEERMGKGGYVKRQKAFQNNKARTDSLFLVCDGLELSPSIRIAPYYEEYQAGRPVEEIASELYGQLTQEPPDFGLDLDGLGRFEQQKERVIFRLIHYDSNREQLEQLPHMRLYDLAVVFCLYLQETKEGCVTAMIQNRHMEGWGCTAEQLYDLACENTPRLLPWRLQSLEGMLRDYLAQEMGTDRDVLFPESKRTGALPKLFVLTNACGIYGASCILYGTVLEYLADSFMQDLYILPSSVHEVILVPASPEFTVEKLEGIVRDANRTEVDEEERLSDRVYLYSRREKRILDKSTGTC